MECFCGIDLSSTSDLTCVSYLFPTEEAFDFIVKYYLPEAALYEKRFKELYGEWRRQGIIKITPGNVVDYDIILNDMLLRKNWRWTIRGLARWTNSAKIRPDMMI